MKKVLNAVSIAIVVTVVSIFTSCKKSEVVTPQTPVQTLLTAKTWQVEEVTDHFGTAVIRQYKRGAANNQDDFSMIRQKFNANGSITYIDEFGLSGSDGLWQLQDNNTKLKLSMPSMNLSIVCDEFSITANSFTYKLKSSATEYMQFTFSPVQ